MTKGFGINVPSLTAQRRLSESSSTLSKSYERLSSGQRINKASDDAAGLAIADALNSRAKIYGQAVRNANDGLSLYAIADSAVSSLTDINTRLQELASQAANGVYSSAQRQALDAEAQALSKEYFRISRAAQFNGTRLFDGSMGTGLTLQLGIGRDGTISGSVGGKLGTGSVTLAMTMDAESQNSVDSALGDLNGDGLVDLVTAGADPGGGIATVRLGVGDGSFRAAVSYQMDGTYSLAVALGDLNRDGILDLVTAGSGAVSGGATIRLGVGDGSFGVANSFQTETDGSSALSLGDLNGDGILDLVTAGSGGGNGRATVRLGVGNGSFGVARSFQMEVLSSNAVSLGDLNGDGKLDLITAGSGAGSGRATIRLGTGDGSFSTAVSYQMEGYGSFGLSLGDLNRDGILDLVTAGWASDGGRATVRLGFGNGSFDVAQSFQMDPYRSNDVSLGDLNGDGVLDLITVGTNYLQTDTMTTIRIGSGTGDFGAAISTSVGIALNGYTYINGVKTGDINGDGVSDIITTQYYNSEDFGSGHVGILFGNTRDGISPLQPFSLKSRADALQAMGLLSRTAKNISDIRASLGATQSRANVALGGLATARESFMAAESRIRDIDIAQESAQLISTQIRQQAAAAVLAQSNQAPALALRLLT